MGSHLDGSSHALGICLAVYVPQLILGDKWYCLGLGGWASGSSKVMLCDAVQRWKDRLHANTSENSSNKAEIYGSLAPGARGVWIPSYSPSSTCHWLP